MGLGPREVDDLSLWEFGQIMAGWEKANGTSKPESLAEDEHDRLMAKYH